MEEKAHPARLPAVPAAVVTSVPGIEAEAIPPTISGAPAPLFTIAVSGLIQVRKGDCQQTGLTIVAACSSIFFKKTPMALTAWSRTSLLCIRKVVHYFVTNSLFTVKESKGNAWDNLRGKVNGIIAVNRRHES